MSAFKRFLKNERGAAAIEYTLIAALLSVAVMAGFDGVGTAIIDAWNNNIMPLLISAFT